MTLVRRLSACLALAALTSCGTAPVRITSPLPGLAVFMPVDIDLNWDPAADPGSQQVTINGVDITSLLELSVTPKGRIRAVADDVWGAGVVLLGQNVIQAQITIGGVPHQHSRSFETTGDPYADDVLGFTPGTDAGFGQTSLPGIVLGGPVGEGPELGSLDVLSLGQGGVLDLEFVDNAIVNGPGVDFTVFENAFFTTSIGFVDDPFAEPVRVSVSQDGVQWFAFACDDAPLDPPFYPGCAGVYPTLTIPTDPTTTHASVPSVATLAEIVGQPEEILDDLEGSGGDSFDLDALGLAWIAFVRIEDIGSAIGQPGTVGADIDAVAGVNTIPFVDENGNDVPDAFDP